MDVGRVISTFGKNTIDIGKKLLEDEELCKLLYYSDNPLEGQPKVPDKMEKLLHNNIVVNTEAPVDNNKGSYILINFDTFTRNQSNNETMDVTIYIDVIVPTSDWVLRNGNMRPYAIMEKVADIVESLEIDSIGGVEFGGASSVVLGNGLSGYSMKFINYQLGT